PAPTASIASEAAFQELITDTDEPVLVLFDANWRQYGKSTDTDLPAQRGPKARLRTARVDVEALPQLPRKYRIAAVPTLVLFRDGHAVARRIGDIGAPDIERWLERNL